MGHCASTLAILVAGLALTAFVPPVDATSLYHAHRGHITGHSSYHSAITSTCEEAIRGGARRTDLDLALPPTPETRSPMTTIMTVTDAITCIATTFALA